MLDCQPAYVLAMASQPRPVRTLPALRSAVARFRAARETIALVPTMGALHAGHLSLIRLARRRARRTIVSLFVNPAQFAPSEDFLSYPRNLGADRSALAGTGVDLIWAPATETMYPDGFAARIVPGGPALAGLEDKFRPHFFAGVATVVTKLILQCRPEIAVFGEKDYQQLKVIAALARDLDMPVKIVGGPTMRERDGLAMSSRNAYLSAPEREKAALIHQVLAGCAAKIARGVKPALAVEQGRAALTQAGFVVDYLEARHAETLQAIESRKDGPIRLLAAARLGATRLIDNVAA
jgi:pantoate--beta-alanine ligase